MRSFWLIAYLLLVGCAEEISLPEARSLSVSDQQLELIYGLQLGNYSVRSDDIELPLDGTKKGAELDLRLFYPTQVGQFPLVIFSHGNWSDYGEYDRVIHHWVSHGYVVIAPFHDDGGGMVRGIFNSLRYGQLGLVRNRTDDIRLVLDQSKEILAHASAFGGSVDPQRIAVAGHSFGAFSAQQMFGAAAYDPDNDQWQFARDDRVDAVIAISPPGPMFDVITDQSWRQMRGPVLMTTGTWDVNAQFWPDWKLHQMSYQTAQAGQQYSLVIEGADHYFGNLICRTDRKEASQEDALAILNAVTIAFLDAKLRDDARAITFLQGDQLQRVTQDFAVLSRR